ncbi:MAG: IS110 family transposase [Deltaproteobacteria bacterium]|nr:IS110 family transposase [Deltaproteobacteria bacterium]
MELKYERCAGLDVHKETVVACVRVAMAGGKASHEVRSFGTTTSALLELSEWLETCQIKAVGMEATGVYWRPVWHVLEGDFELTLANARAVKGLPGRKTDVNDAMWLSDLLAHGLIRGNFVPERPMAEIRDFLRTRKQFAREKVRHTQRIQKILEDANIKLDSVISNVVGTSGRRILRAIIAGTTSKEFLASLGSSRLKASKEELAEACRGFVRDPHRFLLEVELDEVEHLEAVISKLEGEVAKRIEPFRGAVEMLMEIPGVGELAARTIVSEIGIDMNRFPSDAHLISWAGLCPRSDESAGKKRSTRIRDGAPWLREVLVQCAWSATRAKGSYLRALFYRLRARRGPLKALIAVARTMLQSAYHMLRNGEAYRELGEKHFDTLNQMRTARRLVQRLQKMGYAVNITGLPAAEPAGSFS